MRQLMNITYIPEVIDGVQRQGDEIIKYDVHFEKGETREILDEKKAQKLLCMPYFIESIEGEVDVIPAPKKKSAKKKING